ncbi:MAG: RluA family pseudouridine synthase [Planctomycetia bacterium]|nr:RluA family pseudouridine synthase [Planctomycetia bacterium]RLT12654.1 MAG: RluA family pseudouridine synthase [Planctomycetota bacterium]
MADPLESHCNQPVFISPCTQPRVVEHGKDQVAIQILLIDDQIVVVDKPAGIPSVPARTPLDPPSVIDALASDYGRLEAVHRLDRDTSGVLILARTPSARAILGRAFESRDIYKRYLAVVTGTLPSVEGIIDLPLADDLRPPRKRVDPILGRRAISRWRQLATSAPTSIAWAGRVQSLLELEPLTGRSHQLRVHLAWMGTPIVGDPLYCQRVLSPALGPTAQRLGLHAAWINFPHPAQPYRVQLLAAVPEAEPWIGFADSIALWQCQPPVIA